MQDNTLNRTPPQRTAFGSAFAPLCIIELFERLAFFACRTVVGVYIMQADDIGGLHWTAKDKGTIFFWWAIFQSGLPIVTGGFADRYGFKRTLAAAIALNALGYVLMAFTREYWSFFTAVMVLGLGTAFFKPSLQGSLAQNLNKTNSSVGWGIFYWTVNIGGLLAPFVNKYVLGDHSQTAWRNLFLVCGAFTTLNLLLLLTFKDVPSGANKTDSLGTVIVRTFVNILEPRLIAFLLIMSGFWLMMYQLWDLHPNFINDWVDSTALAESLRGGPAWLFNAATETFAGGSRIPQQYLLNVNSLFIILFMIPVSWVVKRMRTLSAMLIGMFVAMIGILVAGWTGNVWVFLLGVVFFSMGEMLTGPKKNEYLGLIAPPGKKGLYLGYVNIPVGIGVSIGSLMANKLYGIYGEKATLALKYLVTQTPFRPKSPWDGSINTLEAAAGIKRTEAMQTLQQTLNLDAAAATRLLWDTYQPQYYVWLPIAAVGFVSFIALAIFGHRAKRWADMNA